MAVTSPPRTIHVEHCMGTAFSIDIRDSGDWSQAIDEVVAWLHHVDGVFSTYRTDSDVSRLGRGEGSLADLDPDIAVVLELCAEVQAETAGCFSATAGGVFDPTGLVKGWAIERASALLRDRGALNHAVNGGGDAQLAGSAGPGRPWTVGVVDPCDGSRVLTTLAGVDFAIATSGTAERGVHIIDPHTALPATALASATVVGPSLTYADAYATAAFVMGTGASRWMDGIDHYAVLLIDPAGHSSASTAWPGARQ